MIVLQKTTPKNNKLRYDSTKQIQIPRHIFKILKRVNICDNTICFIVFVFGISDIFNNLFFTRSSTSLLVKPYFIFGLYLTIKSFLIFNIYYNNDNTLWLISQRLY